MELVDWPVADVVVAGNDRKVFDEHEITRLAALIEKDGLLHPITVRPSGELVAGERRLRAFRHLGRVTIPAIIRRDDSDADASRLKLIENIGRVDLNPIEEARAFHDRMEEFELTEAQVAEWAGVLTQRVRSRVALLGLREDVQHLVAVGQLGASQAAELVGLDNNRQGIMLQWLQKQPAIPTVAIVRERAAVLRNQQLDEAMLALDEDILLPPETAPPWGNTSRRLVREGLLHDQRLPEPPRAWSIYGWLRAYQDKLVAAEFTEEAKVVGSVLIGMLRAGLVSDPDDSGRKKKRG